MKIDGNFFASVARRNNEWERMNRLSKYVLIRFAVHGFYYELCKKLDFASLTTRADALDAGKIVIDIVALVAVWEYL